MLEYPLGRIINLGLGHMIFLGILILSTIISPSLWAIPNETVIARAQEISDSNKIKGTIALGEQIAQKFSQPEFTEKFHNIQAYKDKQQDAWNNTPLIQWTPAGFTIQICNADVAMGALFLAHWTLEHRLYQALTGYLTDLYIAQWQTSDPSKTLELRSLCNQTIGKAIVTYSIVTTLLHHIQKSYRLTQFVGYIDALHRPCSIAFDLFSPNYWSTQITKQLINFGLLTPHADDFWAHVAKECVVHYAWLIYYTQTVAQDRIKAYIVPHVIHLNEMLQSQQIPNDILHKQIHPSFTTWTQKKIPFTPIGHAVCDACIAGPALYRIGHTVYKTVQELNHQTNLETS